MSFLSRLFGRKSPGSGSGDLEKRLEKLEAEADNAAPGYVGTAYNRAGDVALRGGESARAIGYYGRSIDAFLSDGQREAARGVANKIIRVRPTAVRTLCTLTWLDLAARHSATALLHLRDYVEAAKAIERTGIAANQIYEMARVAPDEEFIAAVADALDVLDYSSLGQEVRGWVKTDGSPDAIRDSAALAEACLEAAIKSNERGEQGKAGAGEEAEDAEPGDDAPRDDEPEEEPVEDGPEPVDSEDEAVVEEEREPADSGEEGPEDDEPEPSDAGDEESAGAEPEPFDAEDEDPAADEPEPTDAENGEPAEDAEPEADEEEPGDSGPEDDPSSPKERETSDPDAEAGTSNKKKRKKKRKKGKKR